MDSEIEAARPWVQEAKPTFITLIDREHLLSSLYNMVNVPQAVWIDERGRIVRPTETGGSLDIVKQFDPAIGGFPEDAMARAAQTKQTYLEAVQDWASKGSESRHILDAASARARLPDFTPEMAESHALFRLGTFLEREGRSDEAAPCFARARELHPDSINIFRQTSEKIEGGIAAAPEFWEKVMGLGDKPFYAPIEMDGLGE